MFFETRGGDLPQNMMCVPFISDLGDSRARVYCACSRCGWGLFWHFFLYLLFPLSPPVSLGWSGGAMVLGKLPVPGRPTIWMIVGQGPNALAIRLFGHFYSSLSFLSPFSLSLGDGPI